MSAPKNPADKIAVAKEAREMGRKLREGKPAVFTNGKFPPGFPTTPACEQALDLAIATLRYLTPSSPIADYCERALAPAPSEGKQEGAG